MVERPCGRKSSTPWPRQTTNLIQNDSVCPHHDCDGPHTALLELVQIDWDWHCDWYRGEHYRALDGSFELCQGGHKWLQECMVGCLYCTHYTNNTKVYIS